MMMHAWAGWPRKMALPLLAQVLNGLKKFTPYKISAPGGQETSVRQN